MQKYQIIIPMSGLGERFRRAGYKIAKPLINIEGLPIMQHVIYYHYFMKLLKK